MIRVEGLNVDIQNKPILQDIDIEIQKGCITSLIGPNGAGKSTLLSTIARLMDYSSGSIMVEDKPIASYPSHALSKKLSILKQSNHTELNITVEQLVNFGRFPYSKGRLKEEDRQQVAYALGLLQLTEIKHRYLKSLSGGQRQRAYIAMTIAQDTDYILLDEPLNNLDMKHSVQIMQTLRRLAKQLHKTVVIVIHDINFASCYSDRIVALKEGKVIKSDETNKVITSDVLHEICDMDVQINVIDGQRICTYFDALVDSSQ